MHEDSTCPVCGTLLAGGMPAESCPACLLGVGLEYSDEDPATEVNVIAEQPGDMVGRYLLVEQIGEGGFGVVFRAEQRTPVKRVVALKVVKPGMDSREVVTRFEAERQALALMDHPNIAKVYDAGTTDLGRPYFVMEHVEGQPLTRFCDGQSLRIRERLALFVRICEAVQHAHQKGVIHRDLKPSNILARNDDENNPRPKIIDFGVAKAIGIELTEKTFFTMFGRVLGTPLYMSPEQAGLLNEVDVDTRGDIYSLGVILYELLTGHLPIGGTDSEDLSFDEMRRRIREEEPLRPSARVFSLPEDQRLAASKVRRVEPAKYRRILSGDLDWIVMRALEKDRNRRYDTAQGFATDVRRYLKGLPVSAGPPKAAYWMSKFVRRNRGPVIASILVLLALIAALLVGGKLRRDDRNAKEYERLLAQVEGVGAWRKEEPGSRKLALKTLRQVADYPLKQIGVTDDRVRQLQDATRNELIACLAWTDLEDSTRLTDAMLGSRGMAALDRAWEHCVLGAENGRLEVWNIHRKAREEVRPGSAEPVKGPLRFSPDGSLVAAGLGTAERWILVLWDWQRNTDLTTTLVGVHACFDFHPKGDGFVMGTPSGTIEMVSSDGTTSHTILDLNKGLAGDQEPELATALRFSPDGRLVAVGTERSGVMIIDAKTGTRADLWPEVTTACLAWSPDGNSLVTGGEQGLLTVLERGARKHVFVTTEAHSATVAQVDWSPDGRFIVSGSQDEIRLWDGRQGVLLCGYTTSAGTLRFSSATPSSAAPSIGPVLPGSGTVSTLQISQSRVCHRAAGHFHEKIIASTWAVNGTVLVTAAGDGLRFWNRNGQQLAHEPEVRVRPGGLISNSGTLYLATEDGITRRSISAPNGRLQRDPYEMLDSQLRDGEQILLSPPGGPLAPMLAIASNDRVTLLDPATGDPVRPPLEALPSTAFLSISPDGMWLAAGTRPNLQVRDSRVRLWNLAAPDKSYQDLMVDLPSTVSFYPVTHHPIKKTPLPPFLMTGNDVSYRMWTIDLKTRTWKQLGEDHLSKMANSWGRTAQMVFSPRGTVAAVTYDRRYLQVLNPITLEVMTQPGFDKQWPLTISPNGQWMATEGPMGHLFIWDLAEVRGELQSLDWPPAVLPAFDISKEALVLP